MRQRVIVAMGISIAVASALFVRSALAQTATIPVRPSDAPIAPDIIYPDAVTCAVHSPAGVTYQVIFYKGQTVSFADERDNVAEYGTTFIRDPDMFEPSTAYKWRLQLGKPGNITAFTLPAGWTSDNCQVGKSIASLAADKQLLKFLTTQ